MFACEYDDDIKLQDDIHRHGEDQSSDWDLEDALARAILSDIDNQSTSARSMPQSNAGSFRDEAEEEKLIERLHARLFPVQRSSKTRDRVVRLHHRKHQQNRAQKAPEPTKAQPQQSLSPEKIDQMITRFRLHDAKRARKITMLQQQQEQRSAKTSSASSSVSSLISPRSRELTRNLPSFQHRQTLAIAAGARERQRVEQHEQDRQLDLSQSLQQRMRSPCICGVSGSPLRGSHAAACERFMSNCDKSNATSEIQKKKQQMRRSVDDMMRFHEEKKRKQAERAQIQQRREELKTTFTPQINPNSRKIYEELIESGRLHSRKLPQSVKSPRPETPPLCARSKLVLQQPRKQAHAASHDGRRRLSIISRTSSASPSSVWGLGRHRLPKASSFSESHWTKEAQAASRRYELPMSSLPPPFMAPWTEVAFNASTCSFILDNFAQRKWFA